MLEYNWKASYAEFACYEAGVTQECNNTPTPLTTIKGNFNHGFQKSISTRAKSQTIRKVYPRNLSNAE
jgi:hypothetical protein